MSYSWQTKADGRVAVNVFGSEAENDYVAIELAGPSDATRRTDRWAYLAARYAARHHVPLSWLLGVIFAESGGKPDARSPAGAIGLMQVIPKWHATNLAAMLDPARNIDKGASIYRRLMLLGLDLPPAASGYNAGLASNGKPYPSTVSPWGMRENVGYIANVVKANNWYVGRLERGELDLKGPPSLLIGSLVFLTSGGAAWLAARSV